MNVYKRIFDICKKHNCSVADVAKNSGLSLHVIYDWKKSASEPTYSALLKICDYFKITIEEFFDCEEMLKEQSSFIENFEKLNAKQKKLILDTIKICIENK